VGIAAMGTVASMKIMRTAALAGIASTVYKQARKPENQALIKGAIAKARAGRSGGTSRRPRTR
jgi:hypothetical protein